jgi:polypeptide N-acetylgalactosaminyltransferase
VPFVSPAVAGGIFLIARSWFLHLGGFDDGLETWGGESLEISLKTWLCGGRVEICACSRIGHIFRKKHPYTFPLGNSQTFLRNSKRIAEVWLDDYKHSFYNARPQAYSIETGDLVEAKENQAKLKCRPFAWYLQNVFVELKIPSEDYIGKFEI